MRFSLHNFFQLLFRNVSNLHLICFAFNFAITSLHATKNMPQTLFGHFFLKNHSFKKLQNNKKEKNDEEQIRQNYF